MKPNTDNSTQLKEILISLIGNAPSGILLIDLHGDCTLANSYAADVLDRSVSDLVDLDVESIFEEIPILHRKIRQVLTEGRQNFELPELMIGSNYYTIRSRVVIDGQLIVIDDITESVNNRCETERLVEELRHANQELRDFAYISSHDMKSPVASLYGLIELLASENAVKPEHQELLAMVQRSVTSVRDTIATLNEVLKYRHSLQVDRSLSPLDEVLNDVQQSIEHLIEDKNVNFVVDFDACPELPMSRMHMKSLLLNLVSNSIKYSHPDRAVEIQIRSELSSNATILTVSDNGLGIDLEVHGEKLFGLFNRFHTHTEGSGIGLYIVQSIVKCYSGDIAVRSKVDHGTEFIMEIPHA